MIRDVKRRAKLGALRIALAVARWQNVPEWIMDIERRIALLRGDL
ncbi:hypothetical protein [Paracoccus hibiscisoli]|nr:hypothetical protein [Paracoccus hibiscisoli]